MAEEDTDWSYSSTVPTLSKCYLPGVPNHIFDTLYLVSHEIDIRKVRLNKTECHLENKLDTFNKST